MTGPAQRRSLRVVVAAADVKTLATLHADCLDASWGSAAIARIIKAPGGFALLARSGTQPAGFILARVAAGECELLTLGVAKVHRRAGLARRLLAAALDHAAAMGAKSMVLEVAEDNRAARALYATAGFMSVGRRAGYYVRRAKSGRGAGGSMAALVLRRPIADPAASRGGVQALRSRSR